MSRTKASSSHLPLSLFEGILARNAFLRDSGCTKCCVLQDKMCLGRWMGKLVRRTASEHVRLNRDHSRIGPAVELRVQVSFSPLGLSKNLKDVLHESFVFTSSTFTFLMDVLHESFVSTSSTFRF